MKKKPEKGKEKKVRLQRMDLHQPGEADWLFRFIHKHHSVPKFILPSLEDLHSQTHIYFRAFVDSSPGSKELLGVNSYEIRTHYLAETQQTILDPEFRGGGWGKVISQAVEDEVRKAGFYKVRSCIYFDNFAMLQIKLAQGYIIEGFHPDHDGPGLHEYSLGKILKRVKATGKQDSYSIVNGRKSVMRGKKK